MPSPEFAFKCPRCGSNDLKVTGKPKPSDMVTCGGCGTNESVVGCVHCGVDHGVGSEPVLVAGLKSSVERTARPRSNRSSFVPLSEVERPREAEG